MTAHRADRIIEAITGLIEARVQPLGVKVFKHRRLSLAGDQDELPAISVDYGEDTPVTQNTAFIDSLLSVQITSVAANSEEPLLRLELLELRREAHRALMANTTLGLAFVVSTSYGGAEAPQIDATGEQVVGALTAPWMVFYRMNIEDPGD